MGKVLGILLISLVLVVGVVKVIDLSDPSLTAQKLEQQRYQAQLNQIDLQAHAEREKWWTDVYSAVKPFVIFGGALVSLALGLGAVAVAVIMALRAWDDRQKTRGVYHPDQRGLLPVTINALDQAAQGGLLGYHTAQITAAEQPRLPDSLRTYSPRYLAGRPPAQMGAAAPNIETPAPPLALPGRVDLLGSLQAPPTLEQILLGLGPGGAPLYVGARDLCHVALAGTTGGGKSNLMRLLMGQLLAAGAQAVLIDPHYTPYDAESGEDWRPIEGRLSQPPAVHPDEITGLLEHLATVELPERLQRRSDGEKVGKPLFIGVDEFPAIVPKVKQAPEWLGEVLREGRKVGLLTITSTQDMLVKTLGTSSGVREMFRTGYYVGGDATTARVVLGTKGNPDAGNLGQGVVMLRSKATPAPILTRVPYASNESLYALLPTGTEGAQPRAVWTAERAPEVARSDAPRGEVARSGREVGEVGRVIAFPGVKIAPAEVDEVDEVDPQDAQVIKLMKGSEGAEPVSMTSAIQIVYGIRGGEKFQLHAARIRAIMLKAV